MIRRRLVVFGTIAAVLGLAAAYTLQTEPGWYVRLRYPLRYQVLIRAHARNYKLDPALVAAVIYAESKFDPQTRSTAGAIGLMQLLPSTAQGIALRTGGARFSIADLIDPEINIRYGCWYLRFLVNRYHSLELALAAYNAGEANVDRWVAATPAGAPVRIAFSDTRDYVTHVLDLRVLYRRGYGL